MLYRGYDLVGDVHGCAHTLEALLERLGYCYRNGCYRHPERQAIFIGDLIDRGRHVREALHRVKEMVDQGAAQVILGNHEYNAVAYHQSDGQGGFLRDHGSRHRRQIATTLTQFADHPREWADFLAWFRRLPLYLEGESFRAVHACWDSDLIGELERQGRKDFSEDDFLAASAQPGTFAWKVADRLLRGPQLALPDQETMWSADGYLRRVYRTRFWPSGARTHGELAFQPDPLPAHIADRPLSEADLDRLRLYAAGEPPLFIGHYWLEGVPRPLTPNIACLDYSAVKGGKLVAYRLTPGRPLEAAGFVWVPVMPQDLPEQE